MRKFFCVMLFVSLFATAFSANAECVKTDEINGLQINQTVLDDLKELHIDESFIWKGIIATSVPETSGCWAGPSGDDDLQILSLGIEQWNFGQNSLQPILRIFKAKSGSDQIIAEKMPKFGAQFFSDGCLRLDEKKPQVKDRKTAISQACFDFVRSNSQKSATGLKPDFYMEVQALFESPLMRQVQVDQYTKNISSHKKDILNFFGDKPTYKDIKWVIDITVQQGGMPPLSDAENGRNKFKNLSAGAQQKDLGYLVEWYESVCNGSDSKGVGTSHGDCSYNVERLKAYMNSSWHADLDTIDLLLLTRLKSRISTGESGVYQANCFERRAQIALGCGMVSGSDRPCSFYPGDKGKSTIASN